MRFSRLAFALVVSLAAASCKSAMEVGEVRDIGPKGQRGAIQLVRTGPDRFVVIDHRTGLDVRTEIGEREWTDKLTESRVLDLLEARYPLPEWVLVRGVRDSTGFRGERTADAAAVNCYPSKGCEIHGFEVKVSRSDWLKELRAPGEKSDRVARFCHRWWIVAPADVVKRDELPAGWGTIVVGDELRTGVQAPLNEARTPIDVGFMASMLRASKTRDENEIKKRIDLGAQARYAAGVERGRDEAAEHDEELKRRHDRLVADVAAFREASGVDLSHRISSGWHNVSAADAGRAFKSFLEFHEEATKGYGTLTALRANLREIAERTDRFAELVAEMTRARLDAVQSPE